MRSPRAGNVRFLLRWEQLSTVMDINKHYSYADDLWPPPKTVKDTFSICQTYIQSLTFIPLSFIELERTKANVTHTHTYTHVLTLHTEWVLHWIFALLFPPEASQLLFSWGLENFIEISLRTWNSLVQVLGKYHYTTAIARAPPRQSDYIGFFADARNQKYLQHIL